ncbi:FAD-dependent monooxygenase [Paracoccus denitrificans]|uniref:FAD-dependent monooxygenase n=1 Tax=Paracoccus denitrificans TaxID=266 RepID=UPI00131A3E47|nr:FAD-dependent monooxygenase [Paracoccus denitrificans]
MTGLPRWSRGRVLLLGDAAHCLTPVSGQGAGVALATAEMLGMALQECASLPKALALHEARLRPVIGRLQACSREMASVFIPQSPFAFRLRNLVMRRMPKKWLGRYLSGTMRSEMELLEKQA